MSSKLSLSLLLVAIGIFVLTIVMLKKERFPVKYSLIWFFVSLVLLCCSFLPHWLVDMTQMIGFQIPSNFIVGVLFILTFIICIVLTAIVSEQNKKITLLVQEISILKSQINGNTKEIKKDTKEKNNE